MLIVRGLKWEQSEPVFHVATPVDGIVYNKQYHVVGLKKKLLCQKFIVSTHKFQNNTKSPSHPNLKETIKNILQSYLLKSF